MEKSRPRVFQWSIARSASSRSVWPTISVELAEAKLRHDLADLFGDKPHEVDRVGRVAGEVLAKLRVLRGDPDRAGVQMADPHHDAAERNQRRGGEAELFRAEQGGDDHVPARLELPVGLDGDARAQVVQDQGLMRFGQPQFPRAARRA